MPTLEHLVEFLIPARRGFSYLRVITYSIVKVDDLGRPYKDRSLLLICHSQLLSKLGLSDCCSHFSHSIEF